VWEYVIREFQQEWGDPSEARAANAFVAELNELGQEGWEAVGMSPRTHYDRGGGPPGWDSFTFLVLLKRRVTAKQPAERDAEAESASV